MSTDDLDLKPGADVIVPLDEDLAPEGQEPGKEKVISADDGVADFKAQLAETKRRAEEAETARRRAEADAHTARAEAAGLRSEADASRLETITTAHDATVAEIATAKREWKEAQEAGEYDKAADAQEKLADAVARKRELERGKADLEAAGKKPATRNEQHQDPVEDYIGQFSPRSQAWLRDHKDFVTDRKKNLLMIAADTKATASDIRPDTDEYFEFIETELGLRADDGNDGNDGEQPEPVVRQQPAPRRQAPSLAARPSRQPPAANGRQNPREVHLSAEEVEMAALSGLTRAEYAKNKLALAQQGKLGTNN